MHGDEDRKRWHEPDHREGNGFDDEPRDQHRPRTDAIDQKADRHLQDAGDDVEGHERQAKLRIGDAEILAHDREQGRQDHHVGVADEMRQADGADDAQVVRVDGSECGPGREGHRCAVGIMSLTPPSPIGNFSSRAALRQNTASRSCGGRPRSSMSLIARGLSEVSGGASLP